MYFFALAPARALSSKIYANLELTNRSLSKIDRTRSIKLNHVFFSLALAPARAAKNIDRVFFALAPARALGVYTSACRNGFSSRNFRQGFLACAKILSQNFGTVPKLSAIKNVTVKNIRKPWTHKSVSLNNQWENQFSCTVSTHVRWIYRNDSTI